MPGRPITRIAASALPLVSTALLHVTLSADDPSTAWTLCELGGTVLLCLGARGPVTRYAVALMAGVALLPLAINLLRQGAGVGLPLETQLTLGLRNLMLLLALCGGRLAAHGISAGLADALAGLASLFVVLFAVLRTPTALAYALAAGYVLLGLWWLARTSWAELEGRFAPSGAIQGKRWRATRGPSWWVFAGCGLAVLCCGLAFREATSTTSLWGFMPSSGGQLDYSEVANGGIGDGDQLVAAQQNPSSVGPIETDLFIESKQASLFDVFNELGELPLGHRKSSRAIALAPDRLIHHHLKKLTVNEQAGREFSTVRNKPQTQRQGEQRTSDALMYVTGRVPLHLAVRRYDTWDGRNLSFRYPKPPAAFKLSDPDGAGDRWAIVSYLRPAWFGPEEEHELRIIHLKSDRLPSPGLVTAARIDELNSADLFRWSADASLRMDVEAIPPLSTIHLKSQCGSTDWSGLDLATHAPATAEPFPKIAALARSWVEGVPAGCQQVEALCERLKKHCVLDPEAVVPSKTKDTLEHFLTQSRRGPSYLFAASAAVMLRSLGYESRVVSGFYADPKRYDPVSKRTPVLAEDLHFWVEIKSTSGFVFLRNGDRIPGTWLPVEPSPGHTLLGPQPGWRQRVVMAAHAALHWALQNAWLIALSAATLTVLMSLRTPAADLLLTAVWEFARRGGSERSHVLWTLWLIEWRASLRRRARPKGEPLGAWLLRGAPEGGAASPSEEFVKLAQWALYGGRTVRPTTGDRLAVLCRQAVRPAPSKKDPR